MSEFTVNTEYPGFVYVGQAQGIMEDERNNTQRAYYNIFVLRPVSSWLSDTYRASGLKAEKLTCVTSEVLDQGFQPGDRVKLFFDDKKKVVMAALDN